MFINYFGNSSILSISQKKAMIERIYWIESPQRNVKRVSRKKILVNRKDLLNERDHFFLCLCLHQACFVSNVLEKMVDLTTLNILRTARAILMIFCMEYSMVILNYLGVQCICLIQQILACEKVKGNNIQSHKSSAFNHFSLPRYS